MGKRIVISERQARNLALDKYIAEIMLESVVSEARQEIDSKQVQDSKIELMNKLGKMIEDGNPYIRKIANNIGINLDYNKKAAFSFRNPTMDRQGNLTNVIADEMLHTAEILKKYVAPNGRIDFQRMEEENPEDYDNIMRMRDFIDQMGMTHLYDTSFIKNADKRRRLNGKYGVAIDRNGNIDTSNFDLNNISDADIESYREEGNNGDLTDFEIIMAKRKSIIDKYMSSKYGLQLQIPKQVFSAGNTKLPSDTLIINFTSAQRCPAWNECLVKHACYARTTEHMRSNVRDANTARNLMWEAGHEDPELMQMIYNLIKSYIFDYEKALSGAKENIDYEIELLAQDIYNKNLAKNKVPTDMDLCSQLAARRYLRKDKNATIIKKLTPEKLRLMKLADMPNEMREALKSTARIHDIRLNEDGDFIGNWLIEAWDEFAGELALAGVHTTCYTCRNLQFDKVKNIIINASSEAIKGSAVARYFFAVDETMYNCFDETYSGKENALVFVKGEDGKPKVEMNIQPLFDPNTMEPNGKYYYKCPCGRSDIALSEGKKDKNSINCYQCRTCYQPNNDPRTQGKPYYVLVKVHGSGKNDFAGRVPSFGVSQNYLQKRKEYDMAHTPKSRKKTINEGVNAMNDKLSENQAIQQITTNAINSINEHLSNL